MCLLTANLQTCRRAKLDERRRVCFFKWCFAACQWNLAKEPTALVSNLATSYVQSTAFSLFSDHFHEEGDLRQTWSAPSWRVLRIISWLWRDWTSCCGALIALSFSGALQEFEIELEGSQTLRILCYEKCYNKMKLTKEDGESTDRIMGKGQIQVRLHLTCSWLLQNMTGFLILEHPRELFFCLLIVSTLGVFLQTVRNTVRFTSGKSTAFSLLPCPPCLLHCPYYKRCFFRKNRFWSLDFPFNFNTSSRGYRSCSEPWVLLRQKRKQWKYCAEEHYLPSFPVCWKLIDVLARPWRTGLLSW